MTVTTGETRISRSPALSSGFYTPPPLVTPTKATRPAGSPTGRASLHGWRAWMADRIGWRLDPPAERAWRWAEPEAALYRARTLAAQLDELAAQIEGRPCDEGGA